MYLWDCWCDLAELIDKQKFVYGVVPEGLDELEHVAQSINDSGTQTYVFRNMPCIEIEIFFSAVNLFPLNSNKYTKL